MWWMLSRPLASSGEHVLFLCLLICPPFIIIYIYMSVSHTLCLYCSLPHLCFLIYFPHPLTHSLTHSFTHSLTSPPSPFPLHYPIRSFPAPCLLETGSSSTWQAHMKSGPQHCKTSYMIPPTMSGAPCSIILLFESTGCMCDEKPGILIQRPALRGPLYLNRR